MTTVAEKRPERSLLEETGGRANARYDAAQTTDSNRDYWANADGLSARLANSPAVRNMLRKRSRYEVANNCYAKGMLRTTADYVVGTGPRLQVLTADEKYNREVETKFHQWARLIRFGRKLWTMRFAWAQDGEAFGQFSLNMALRHPVKLDINLLEAEQIADSIETVALDIQRDDGIILDDYGNVVGYRVWKHHPSDLLGVSDSDVETVSAANMMHLYRLERPGQLRAVPEITPALMLYPTMRRYTYASLGAAEKAARIAGVIKSTYAVDDPQSVAAMEAIQLEADSFLTMPEGWDISQVKSEQPSDNYEMFKREIISEMARCLNQPFNIAAANSSRYNFASGKLDHLGWYKTVGIDQEQMNDDAATPAFSRWFYEASRLPGYLPSFPADGESLDSYMDSPPPHVWFWDGQDTIDPREASAKATGLQFGTETLGRIWAKKGLDAEQELRSQAKLLGMPIEDLQESLRNKYFGSPQAVEEPDESEADDADEA